MIHTRTCTIDKCGHDLNIKFVFAIKKEPFYHKVKKKNTIENVPWWTSFNQKNRLKEMVSALENKQNCIKAVLLSFFTMVIKFVCSTMLQNFNDSLLFYSILF